MMLCAGVCICVHVCADAVACRCVHVCADAGVGTTRACVRACAHLKLFAILRDKTFFILIEST